MANLTALPSRPDEERSQPVCTDATPCWSVMLHRIEGSMNPVLARNVHFYVAKTHWNNCAPRNESNELAGEAADRAWKAAHCTTECIFHEGIMDVRLRAKQLKSRARKQLPDDVTIEIIQVHVHQPRPTQLQQPRKPSINVERRNAKYSTRRKILTTLVGKLQWVTN